ncbi:hypothetical protein [Brevibacterium sp. ZH18]|uniref:hypothetical protein n=1 Tax=Brevibacterium sp. ZH18 TaxID=2927784 RepID=UPI001F617EC9|nr:hypothetical protein [Brevibacterium sp. ZH18]
MLLGAGQQRPDRLNLGSSEKIINVNRQKSVNSGMSGVSASRRPMQFDAVHEQEGVPVSDARRAIAVDPAGKHPQ